MSDLLSEGLETSRGPGGFWGSMHPSLRSAVIIWVFLIAFALVNSFTAGGSIVICYPLQLLLYLANGALAARFALDSGYSVSDLPRLGAFAALLGWLAPAIFYFVLGILLGVVTLGAALIGTVLCIACGPIDLALHAACGALGAYLYGQFSGIPPEPTFL